MPRLYTVDRQGTLRPGMTLDLVRYSDISPPELQVHVDEMFPTGVSSHGDRYFLKNDSLATVVSPSIEILFEYVRRARYPSRPSRFQSVFAVEDISRAVEFRNRFGPAAASIWEVRGGEGFRADMHLLTARGSILWYSYRANQYWRGESGPDPFWELLLVPPVQVVRKVAEATEGRGAV